jgi:hypothetical protein
MQLNLAFLDPSEPQASDPAPTPTSSQTPNPWDHLDEAARNAALEILARLIARMLASQPTTEASHD